MDYEFVRHELEEDAAVITLNRPQRRNALSLELMLELIYVLGEVGRDKKIRSVILASEGKVFCSGHDLTEMTGRTESDYRRLFDTCCALMQKIQSIAQPVIAEVQGIATAAGCEPATAISSGRPSPSRSTARGSKENPGMIPAP